MSVSSRTRISLSSRLTRAIPRFTSNASAGLWSVRVGERYRAIGTDVDDEIMWFWIGTHADYDKIVG